MKTVHHSPTFTFSDIIGFYDAIDYYRKTYDTFYIIAYLPNGNKKKVTCNFNGLIKFLKKTDVDNIYVFESFKYVHKCRRLTIRRDGTVYCNSQRVCLYPYCYKEISLFGEIYITESHLRKSKTPININYDVYFSNSVEE